MLLKSKEEIKTEMQRINLNTVVELPTGDGNPSANHWKLANSTMSCGLKEFQGWSSGYNITNNSNLEDKLFLLTYFSANMHKFKGKVWSTRQLQGEGIAKIGIQRNLNQFLQDKQNYFVSAEEVWMNRLEKFINLHGLGSFLRTPSFINSNYLNHKIQVGVWTWNGNHPPLSAFPHYYDPETSSSVKVA